MREALVRSLTISAAARALLAEFERAEDPSGLGYRCVVGNAWSVVADGSLFDEIEALARDWRWGVIHPAAAAPAGSGVRLLLARAPTPVPAS
jgi:hypothetical protein